MAQLVTHWLGTMEVVGSNLGKEEVEKKSDYECWLKSAHSVTGCGCIDRVRLKNHCKTIKYYVVSFEKQQ